MNTFWILVLNIQKFYLRSLTWDVVYVYKGDDASKKSHNLEMFLVQFVSRFISLLL